MIRHASESLERASASFHRVCQEVIAQKQAFRGGEGGVWVAIHDTLDELRRAKAELDAWLNHEAAKRREAEKKKEVEAVEKRLAEAILENGEGEL